MYRRSMLAGGALALLSLPPAMAQAPVTFDFAAEVRRASAIAPELQSKLARDGLRLFAATLLEVRMQRLPVGDERSDGFRQAAAMMRGALQQILGGPSVDVGNPLPVPPDVVTLMEGRFKANAGGINGFLQKVREASPLSVLSPDDILRYQLWNSMLVASRDRRIWDDIFKRTGWYPLC